MTLPPLRHHLFRVVLCDSRVSFHRNNFVPFCWWWKNEKTVSGSRKVNYLAETQTSSSGDSLPRNLSSNSSFPIRRFSTTVDDAVEDPLETVATASPTTPTALPHGKKGRSYGKRRALLPSRYALTPSGRFLQPVDRSELPRAFVVEMEEKLAPLRARVKEQGDVVRELKSQGGGAEIELKKGK